MIYAIVSVMCLACLWLGFKVGLDMGAKAMDKLWREKMADKEETLWIGTADDFAKFMTEFYKHEK